MPVAQRRWWIERTSKELKAIADAQAGKKSGSEEDMNSSISDAKSAMNSKSLSPEAKMAKMNQAFAKYQK